MEKNSVWLPSFQKPVYTPAHLLLFVLFPFCLVTKGWTSTTLWELLFCFISFFLFSPTGAMGSLYKDEQDDWITVCLKYLLFVFNFLFWVSLRSTLLFKPLWITFAITPHAKCVVFNMKHQHEIKIYILNTHFWSYNE